MSSINRGTLPVNFVDSISMGMRLPQPEPQYLFAQMAVGAMLRQGAIDMGLDNAQRFVKVTAGGGGEAVPPALDMLARAGDMYPEALTYIADFGLGKGDTIKLRRPQYSGGGYDESSREVKPDVPTSTVGQLIKGEEVPIVLKEYEGPYDAANSRVAPYIVRDFDARYKANKDSLAQLVRLHLLRDYIKWLDSVVRNRFRATQYITYADAVANVLSFTAGAGHTINFETLIAARTALSNREWQYFPNGRYVCLVPTAFNSQMVGDPDYRELSANHADGRNQLFGYITSVQNMDIFECTTLKTYAAGDTVPGDGNAVPTGATVYEGLIFGPGAVGMGEAMPPTCFDADDTNYGKEAKVLWRSIQAFQTLDERGVQRVLFQA
jgi:hypothetical protein